MTTYSGVTQTYVDTGGLLGGGSTRPAGGLRDARLKVCLDQLTLAGTEASGSLIKLFGAIPTGANLVKAQLYVSAAQASLTASVGDADSATRYASASTGLQTAVPTVTTIPLLNRVVGTSTNDNQIIITTGGATATAGVLYGVLYYTTD